MKKALKYSCKFLILFILSLSLHLNAAEDEVQNQNSVRLSEHIPSNALAQASFLGRLEASTPVQLTFILPLRNQEALESLLQRIYDPTDKEFYGKYLTPEEFTDRFAPLQEDYDNVLAYAKSLDLEITGIHSNRTLLNVSGYTKTIETAFNLRLDQYQSANGRIFHAPNDNPEVPASIANLISGIVGLDNHALWRPFHRKQIVDEALNINENQASANSKPNGGFSPANLFTAYNLTGVAAKGAGQVIALFELSGYRTSDINAYAKQFGLPTPKLKNILVNGGSGGGIDAEVTLDIELALALAPQSEIYVYEGPNSNHGVLNTYNRIATDNIAKQVSTSWGLGEDLNTQYLKAENAIFQQMAAHGQTIYAAAGDSGAYDDYTTNSSKSLVVDDPASQPYIVAVGGTKLLVNSHGGTYLNESVWNNGLGVGAGGGGVSTYWPIPAWQANVPNVYSKTHRNVPDVSLNADTNTGYAIYHNSRWAVYGGTSCAAPLWAAFTALVNQERTKQQKPPLGFANPLFYAIGTGPSYATDFYDVTTGDNLFYHAAKGYDNATGWGSFNGANLFATLTNTLPLTPPAPPPPSTSPVLNVNMTHSPNSFVKGGVGTYTINIQNSGNGPTSGTVSAVITLPHHLKLKKLTGLGWVIHGKTLTCTLSTPIQAGSSSPTITLIVNIDKHAASSITPTVQISGEGVASSKTTNPTKIK